MGERHLTPKDLSERYEVPIGTVYDWNSEGTGPRYLKIGKHVRYVMADVIAWERTRYASRTVTRKAAQKPAAA